GQFRAPANRPRIRPPIQEVFHKGQEVLVQVIKEGIGNKGPTLSTYISIPGRYLVIMPGLSRVGVSRKILDDDQRRQLRDMVVQLDRPEGLGVIIRTAGLDRTKRDLERDLSYLARLWEAVVARIKRQRGPGVIYQESDMIIRTIRDVFASDIDAIYIDEPTAYQRAKEFLEMVMPRFADRLKLYDHPKPLFHQFGVEEEIARINQKIVPLPKGGSIVIEQTEALVAIDVNSGNFRADDNAEGTAYQINLQAAKEIARQLRLRDLGGVIVNDFIDMREERHRRGVEEALHKAVARDRARTKILRMSQFGMIEMTRQRIRPSLRRSLYRECPTCSGHGIIKSVESMAIECMRLLAFHSQRESVRRMQLTVAPEIATYLQNHKRRELLAVEEASQAGINIVGRELRSPEDFELSCYDAYGDVVDTNLPAPPQQLTTRRPRHHG
ncbi:MAG TPA: Rne/Rng family ribonuclease, partial [Planctomycetia bacterium]|nr:Rne/Rng family ribonuclease [Planctomycetia bacterium]